MSTAVFFHAHPDDEALLTSGTMAKAAAQGHRVVLVVATDGELGLAAEEFRGDGRLGDRRMAELAASAAALGVARVEHLGYADSGMGPSLDPDPPGRVRFVRAPVAEAAARLATIVREEGADVLVTYDPNGGYGHRDHVQAHLVGMRAASLTGVRVLQATVPRDLIAAALRFAGRFYRFPPEFDASSFSRAFSPRSAITHRIDVHRHIAAKRASMRAHASQATADDGDRTLGIFLRFPRPLFDLVFGREWYAEPAALATLRPGARPPIRRDIFESAS